MNSSKVLLKFFTNKNKLKIFIAIFLFICSGVLLAYGPKKIGGLTTIIYQGILKKINGTGRINYKEIINEFKNVLSLYILSAIFIIISNHIITSIVQKGIKNIKDTITNKINKIKLSVFEDKKTKKNISNIYSEIDILNNYLNIFINQSVFVLSIIIGSIYFMFKINYYLSIVSLLLIPSLLIMLKIVSKKYNKETSKNKEEELEGMLIELINRRKLINILNCNKIILEEFNNSNEANSNINKKNKTTIMRVEAFSSLIGNLNLVLILIIGTYLNMIEEITIGDIQSFLLYSKLIERPLFILSKVSNIFILLKDSLNKISDFLNLDEETNNCEGEFCNGDIEFKNLSFNYNNDFKVLNDLNFKIKQGETVAIVGKTGAGKSTMLKLLLKFYDEFKGDICIKNKSIRSINNYELRKNIAIIPQNTWLSYGTIKDNIVYGNEHATEEQIIEAAKNAQIHDFIETLPQKYNTIINESNSNISLGQKQLICLARLFIKNAPIVLLDEATNLIDYDTELKIKEILNKYLKNKTCLIVAHRLSTIANADKIIVLENGEITEEGTHTELLKYNGKYKQMYELLSD